MQRKAFIKLIGIAPFGLGMNNLSKLEKFSDSLDDSPRMPVLFIGHGSPMNALQDNEFVRGFKNISKSLPRPAAILCISAHWYVKGTMVTAMEMPRTIHDFYGFPEELYRQQYLAKGDPALADETSQLLKPTEVELDEDWGLDHGTWTILKHMYPDADIPVLQLSIDYTRSSEYHFELAGRLASLRDKGVLIIGSGNIIHNLRLVDFQNMHRDNYGFDWAVEAREILNRHILEGNYRPLLAHQDLGRSIQLAVPTPDHYLPLIYTLGLKQAREQIELFNDKLLAGSLSMTSLKIS
jgi:4,5-DOPA dioxygenase extradiol